ncbi:MAG TPA: hypothetical protein VNR38_13250 [Ureibacillus sp.]|nr:hypothetical protein [Ureibacillus sp.]
MKSEYKGVIFFNADTVHIDISNDKHTFSYITGIAWFELPNFFYKLSLLYKGEIGEGKLYCHGNGDYYIYSTDGSNLKIEHVDDYYGQNHRITYYFDLKKYLDAVVDSFKAYINSDENKAIFPLNESDKYHPLNDEVLKAFYEFSSLLRELD